MFPLTLLDRLWFLLLSRNRDRPYSSSVRLVTVFGKIRCLLGYKNASYQTVEIPVIMPKPDLMALTGGYRKPRYCRWVTFIVIRR